MNHPINVVLENIRSALNVGAIFRTCDATKIDNLYLTGITPFPPHNKIPKTALGAIEYVNWEHNKNTIEVLKDLKEKGNKIVSIELSPEAKNIYEYSFNCPTSIILGHEISGVSEEAREFSDETIYIPMYGKKESLNVATTCGIVLYEIIRQLNFNS